MKSLVQKLRAAIPKGWKRRARYVVGYPVYWFRLRGNYAYDRRRFGRWSSARGWLESETPLRSWINADYHKIEKALVLKAPRPGFGSAVVLRLVENLDRYLSRFPMDEICVIAINTLREYIRFNQSHGIEDPRLARRVEQFAAKSGFEQVNQGQGGTMEVLREDIWKRGRIDLTDFFLSRHSIRQFDPEIPSKDLLSKAVALARRTPSVCNRQSWKAYVFDEPELKSRVMACQKGNAGFGPETPVAIVVTTDTQTFFAVGERNQCWVDGGLFSMSLVYALHSLGLGAICLNWSVEKADDQALRRVAAIPDSEVVIMLIGVGFPPEKLKVAQSCRKPVEDVLVWNAGR